MFVNKRFSFSTAKHVDQYSHPVFSIFAANLLVKVNREAIIVVATVRVVRVAELPVHITHLLLEGDFLPTSNDGDSGFIGSCGFVQVFQSGGGGQPTYEHDLSVLGPSEGGSEGGERLPYSS